MLAHKAEDEGNEKSLCKLQLGMSSKRNFFDSILKNILFRVPTIMESQGKICSLGKSSKSHRNSEKYQKSRKSKNITLIQIQSIVSLIIPYHIFNEN